MPKWPSRTIARSSVVVAASLLSSCATTTAPTRIDVSHVGEMRAVMREGHDEPRAALVDLAAQPHAFAVGAMAGLEGEVTVSDGDVWITRVVIDKPVTTGPRPGPDDRATLLIRANVSKWRSIAIDAAAGGADLEALIEHHARAGGIDASKPFPFRLEGAFSVLEMHVINGFCPHGAGEADAAHQPWTRASTNPVRAEIVGFYARDSEGSLTHHGTSIHAHAILREADRTLAGHVDAMTIERGATLSLPR